jgi:hypothetical protein
MARPHQHRSNLTIAMADDRSDPASSAAQQTGDQSNAPASQTDNSNGQCPAGLPQDGVTTYSMTPPEQLTAAGYVFSYTSNSFGTFDIWVKTDCSSQIYVQLLHDRGPNSESRKTLAQTQLLLAQRTAQVQELQTLCELSASPDPDVADEALAELRDRLKEFPGVQTDENQLQQWRELIDPAQSDDFESAAREIIATHYGRHVLDACFDKLNPPAPVP